MEAPWVPWVPEGSDALERAVAMRTLQAHIRTSFAAQVARCEAHPSACPGAPPRLVYVLNQTVLEEGEARQMPWPSQPWSFERDEQYTTVIFHKPMAMASGPAAEMQQHLALHTTYLPREGERAEYHHVLATLHREGAWLDSPDVLQGFLHAGGPPVSCCSAVTLSIVLAAAGWGLLLLLLCV